MSTNEQLLDELQISHPDKRQLEYLANLQQRSPEWIKERETHLNASDCAAVLGHNPYQNVAQLLSVKSKQVPLKVTKAKEHGILHEADALREYQKQHPQYELQSAGLYVHPTEPWLAASPDSLVLQQQKIVGVVEVKAPKTTELPEEVPIHHKTQVAIQLYVLDAWLSHTELAETSSVPLHADVFYWTSKATTCFQVILDEKLRHTLEHDYVPR